MKDTHYISEDADQLQSNMEILKNSVQSLDSDRLLELLLEYVFETLVE